MTVKQNDKGYDIILEVVNDDDTPMDLTNATALAMHAVKSDDAAVTVSGTISVVDATAGICKYTVQAGDFAEDGVFRAEAQISFGSSKIITLPTFEIVVEKEIA